MPHELLWSVRARIVAVRDADGRELPLDEPRIAHWRIVEVFGERSDDDAGRAPSLSSARA